MSPYQIVFGRERPEAGLPYVPSHECEGARQYFQRMEDVHHHVAKVLNQSHRESQARTNAKRAMRPPYKVGDWVMVARQMGTPAGSKLDTKWIGPAVVTRHTGEQSYEVQTKPSGAMEVHADQMKPFWQDRPEGRPVPLYHFQPTHHSAELAPDEGIVEAILAHRKGRDGSLMFLTKWEGAGQDESTWEPVGNFVQKCNALLVAYCKSKKLPVDRSRT